MLVELAVERIALIEAARVRLDPGFTVFTGETGAGKSILLDAIGLILGKRASSDLIRTGADDAVVEALFVLSDRARASLQHMLDEWGIPVEDGELVITRELQRSGRTVCRINGRTVTVQMLRELGQRLVQQQGQHDDQGLLRNEEQLRLLDLYGGLTDILAELRHVYEEWSAADQALKAAQIAEQERARRLDMLNFQIDEIEQAGLVPGEEEQLREERRRLQHSGRIAAALHSALDTLQGVQNGAVDALAMALSEVATAAEHDDRLQSTVELLETAQVHAEEAVHNLSRYLDQLDEDPHRLEQVEERLQQIRALERKYGPTVEDVLHYLEVSRREREDLIHHEERQQELEARRSELERQLESLCERLHEARRVAAKRLSEEITKVLRRLSMPHAVFTVRVNRRVRPDGRLQYGPQGADSVVFELSANPGEEPKPLARIASGGELSRTLLAVKSVLAAVDDVTTLVFDEIDAGVSGAAAERIAEELRHLAQDRQVLCVTHSPQIAAAAQWHYVIEKREQGRARTEVRRLDWDGRVQEIARLVGSRSSEDTAAHHAEALLASFQERA